MIVTWDNLIASTIPRAVILRHALILVIPFLGSSPALSEPVLDRALSGLRLITATNCTVIKIDFNFRVRYVSHFPEAKGDELRVTIRPLDPSHAAALATLRREALRAPDNTRAAIKAVEFEPDQPGGPVLRITFVHKVAFQVAPGRDFESIIVAIAGKAANAACRPLFPSRLGTGWDTSVTRDNLPESLALTTPELPRVVQAAPQRGKGAASPKDIEEAGAWMDEARAAIKKGSFVQAQKLLRNVLVKPETQFSAEAQELLGIAHQKAGQPQDARLVYEDYLRIYPSAEGTERIRQRLAGILTANGEPPEKLRSAKEQLGEPGAADRKGLGTWTTSGSISQFYIRDDSFRTLRDPSLAPNLNEEKDAHVPHMNTFMTSFDLIAAMNSEKLKAKFRFSGTEEHRFNGDTELARVSALFAELTFKELDLMTRIGRQTRNAGGVIGRFDGALASWQALPNFRVNVVGGSPVERREDAPFKNDRYFYGASIDFGPLWNGIEASVFAIEQRDRSVLDRQAVGAEFRYIDPNKSGFATFDYDVHFQQWNAAIVSGSWTFADKSTLHAGVDYRKAPYMSATTALQGQPFATLYDVLKLYTKQQVDQFAIDRTPTYQSATVGYAYPLTSKLQLGFDATASNMSGTVASGGVGAMLPTGQEYYLSSQLIASSLFSEGDLYIAGLRLADRAVSDLYVLDLSMRYPLTQDFRVNPRLRLGYEVGKGTDLREITILPSVLFNYFWNKDLSLELEIGSKWTQREQASVRENETEFFFTAGFRYDFYADGQVKCSWMPSCQQER